MKRIVLLGGSDDDSDILLIYYIISEKEELEMSESILSFIKCYFLNHIY